MVPGAVRERHDDEGRGVIDNPQTPGGCWVHFSQIDMQGRAFLEVGHTAQFSFERVSQDGFEWRALSVRPVGTHPRPETERPVVGPSEAYASALTIWFHQ